MTNRNTGKLSSRRLRRNLSERGLAAELCVIEAYSELMAYLSGSRLTVKQARAVIDMAAADLNDMLDGGSVSWVEDPAEARLFGDN